jgi:hypothetical protein
MSSQHRAPEVHRVDHVPPSQEWLDWDPPPSMPTLEEIEIADELRHDLELKYLGKADPCWDASIAHLHGMADEDD